jgi:hypothetical protein
VIKPLLLLLLPPKRKFRVKDKKVGLGLGKMGGGVVKGSGALKHSLRPQFLPFAPNC